MLKYLKKYWGWCLMAPVFMAGEVCMDLLQPDLMRMIVDEGVMKQDMSIIVSYGVRMILLVMFGACCGIASGVCANFGAQNFSNDLRKGLFAKIMNLSFQQTDSFTTGSLVTRLTNDVTQVERMVMFAVRGAVRNVFLFVGSIIMLARLSGDYPKMALIAFPIVFLAMTFFLMKATPLFSVVQMKLDGVNNVMQEDVAGARVVKAYVKEEYELSRFDRANDALCSVNLKVQLLLAFMMPVMNIILNACVLAIIYISGIRNRDLVMMGEWADVAGAVTAGTITAGITYLSQLLHGIMFLANIFQTFTRSKASANRINEVLRVEDVVMDGKLSAKEIREKCEGHKGSVEFKNVAFSYPGGNGKAVLEHIDLKVEPGETLAIIGATGCGKSSLVNLIPRFYDVAEGEILVDGVNVKDYPLRELRDKIAIVLQKAELYSRPIEANIRWGKSDATDWEVKEAAQIAQADDFICRTADGYYTQVTEGGHSLSGGQKQRISVARAMLKDAEILILDDATSALDLKTEAALYAGMKEKIPNVTKIIIAQRIASIQNADRIAVLEDGCIVACGSHSELMADSPVYREIYNSQMKEGESA